MLLSPSFIDEGEIDFRFPMTPSELIFNFVSEGLRHCSYFRQVTMLYHQYNSQSRTSVELGSCSSKIGIVFTSFFVEFTICYMNPKAIIYYLDFWMLLEQICSMRNAEGRPLDRVSITGCLCAPQQMPIFTNNGD